MNKKLGASSIGFPCDRNLFYRAEGHEEEISGRTQRIFDVGHAFEPLAVQWLRGDGWEVRDNPGSQNAEIAIEIPVQGGIITGHPDGIMSKPGTGDVLFDIKTMNSRAFREWKRVGIEAKSPQYCDQLHCYACGIDAPIDKLGIVAINKDDSDMHIDILDYSCERMDEIKQRAERIFSLVSPPGPGERFQDWACNYCGFSWMCELRKAKQNTEVGEEIGKTIDPVIIAAMAQLSEGREMEGAGKDLIDGAKGILGEYMRVRELRSVRGGGYVLTLAEIKSSRFDSTGFKKDHPELAGKYTKESASLRYDVKEVV